MAGLLLKGALVSFLPDADLPSVITFQLNPEAITHGLAASGGTPAETFHFSLMLDANQAVSVQTGFVQGQLDALEGLLFAANPQMGAPAVLFAWGSRRVPVHVTSLTIVEKFFDSQLNPTHAEAQITLASLTLAELEALPAPMKAIANSANAERARARVQALLGAQTVTDP